MSGIIIIGAGQAGQAMATKLRDLGHEGDLTIIGAEPQLPYQRPPLSKKYLLGDMELERLFLRPQAYYDDAGIALRLNTRVEAIHPKAHEISVDGARIAYDNGGDLKGVFCVRDLADIDAMAPYCAPGKQVLIVGGGYIGLEAAAVCAERGLRVVLVEMAERILQRVASDSTSDFFRALHMGRGVEIREGTGLTALKGTDHVETAELSDGRALDVDFVIVGIGIRPATALAEAAGLEIDNGIAVDGLGQTSAQDIYAAGDCTSFPHGTGRLRLESVPNAIDQAEATAAAMLGGTENYKAKPWFWSDQFDVKLQIAGLNTGFDKTYIRPGAQDGTQSVWYYKGDQLLAVDAMPALVSDPETELKSLLK